MGRDAVGLGRGLAEAIWKWVEESAGPSAIAADRASRPGAHGGPDKVWWHEAHEADAQATFAAYCKMRGVAHPKVDGAFLVNVMRAVNPNLQVVRVGV